MQPSRLDPLPDSPFMTLELRAASPTDAPALALLLHQLGPDEPQPDPTLLALRLENLPAGREVLVAEREGQLLGTCTVILVEHLAHNFARSAIVEDVVVDAEARGLGVGKALMEKAAERGRALGCYKLVLSSGLGREAAHAFYESLGYRRHGVSFYLDL
ncbi:GNAT family N-acetyltransferase [Pseudomonas sp. zfem003]|uniref:GNAT family N-acetyltransferase n=1 Tax=Pseudomonas sp. zfem003 TaxID=3078198 RepID=UPI00292A14F6|nr:GNAT family N-acetyltransferase [Pseudomonas sp. zfem003]MDU9397934.1 GNAT family N-acetyltransferase [Pseudomonas sp. zfem003]